MLRLLKSFLYKISKDLTFRITLIIGAGLAILLTAIYVGLQYGLLALSDVEEGEEIGIQFISGHGMLLNSMSPAQNFGLAIPINLITFVCLEFSQGTIRNKIIAGHSKFKIYSSLFINGLIFTFLLLGTYILVCTGLGTIFGGFNFDDYVYLLVGGMRVTPEFLIKMIIICIVTYVSIVSFVVFVATAFRNVGPCIPLVMIPIMICYVATTIISAMTLIDGDLDLSGLINVTRIINPLYAIGSFEKTIDAEYNMVTKMEDMTFIFGIVNNLVYTSIFFVSGSILFRKRDVK